jgi:hypothetical protein
MKVFRGFRNIDIHDVDHHFLSNGYYGPAVYVALNFDAAESYTTGVYDYKRKVIGEYELDESKMLTCSNEDILNLQKFSIDKDSQLDKTLKISIELSSKLSLQSQEIDPQSIGKIALEAGYTALKLIGKVEGGEQVVIPKDSPEKLTLVRTHVSRWISSSKISEQYQLEVERLFGSVSKINGSYWFSFTPDQTEDAVSLLSFHDMIHQPEVQSVDYFKRKVDYYEEEDEE